MERRALKLLVAWVPLRRSWPGGQSPVMWIRPVHRLALSHSTNTIIPKTRKGSKDSIASIFVDPKRCSMPQRGQDQSHLLHSYIRFRALLVILAWKEVTLPG